MKAESGSGSNQPNIDNLQNEFGKIRRQFRAAGSISAIILGTGTVFYHFIEHLSWLDSLYFCTTTLTTIGYGDITPVTRAGKAFTILYAIVGIGVLGYFVNILFRNAVIRRQLRQSKKMDKRR